MVPAELDTVYHARLLADIDRYAEIANIPARYVREAMANYCSPQEIDWIKAIMRHREAGVGGLCLTGIDKEHPVESRMMAMCGALLRNYVDARLMSMLTLMQDYDKGMFDSPTVLLIPNFYLHFAGGKPNTNWEVRIMQDLLMQRMVESKITIIYVQSLEGLKATFGESIGVFIESHWHML